MEIKVEKKASLEAGIAGTLRVVGQGNLDAGRIIGEVTLTLLQGKAITTINALPEDLERAAEVVRRLRGELGDHRSLCATHGYYEQAASNWKCPGCEAALRPVAGEVVVDAKPEDVPEDLGKVTRIEDQPF